MKIAVLSSERVPTVPESSNGLTNSLYEIAEGLVMRGHEVTVFGAPGSVFARGEMRTYGLNSFSRQEFDAYLDGSHTHELSAWPRHDWPVVNRVGDLECSYEPPNAVVESYYMLGRYQEASIAHKGVDGARIPYYQGCQQYAAFYGRLHTLKGMHTARMIADQAGIELRLAGEWTGAPVAGHIGILRGAARWDFLGGASVLLHPSTGDAAPRAVLEAQACGTPVLTLNGDGAMTYVLDGITGYVCKDAEEMVARIPDAWALDRASVRARSLGAWPFEDWIDRYEALLFDVARGIRW